MNRLFNALHNVMVDGLKIIPPVKRLRNSRNDCLDKIEQLTAELTEYKKGNLWLWKEKEQLQNEIIELTVGNREKRNLIAVLYGLQEYQSDLIVDGVYRDAAPITTAIGCPIKCRYCPQSQFVKAYMRRPKPTMMLSLEDYNTILDKIPVDVLVSFSGMVEPFANPNCLEMIKIALDRGYKVRVYSTLYNCSIDDYNAFRKHKNLKTFDLHVPDCQGNTVFPITEKYKELLKYIMNHRPVYGRFWTSCLGIDGGPHPDIADIIQVNGNPINSTNALSYQNYVNHHNAKLKCIYDCGKSNLIFPNGDVVPCTQDWELRHVIGNILETDSWNDLMNSEARQEFTKGLEEALLNTICRKCELAVKVGTGDSCDT